MSQKYNHKGTSRKKLNLYSECFPDIRGTAPETIEAICVECKNSTCIRSGKGSTDWEKRMDTQVEYLLNNPIISNLSTLDHKNISLITPKDLKMEHEAITVNTGGSGWENSNRKIDEESSTLIHIPSFQMPKETSPPTIIDPATLMRNLAKSKNTPVTSGGVMIGGGEAPKKEDPWKNADKTVKPGARVILK